MDKKSAGVENRMIILEEKLEYQDYTLEKLNDVIIAQQNQIDKLEDKLSRLKEKMEANQLEIEKGLDEPTPPHY